MWREALIEFGIMFSAVAVIAVIGLLLRIFLESRFLRGRKRPPMGPEQGQYTLRQPKYVLVVAIVTLSVFFAIFVLAVFVAKDPAGFMFLLFCALSGVLILYYIRWKIIVKEDQLEVFRPLKPPLQINVNSIERAIQEHNGIIVCRDGKKLFGIDYWVDSYGRPYDQLYALGKMESTQCLDHFHVKWGKRNLVMGILCTLLFAGLAIWVLEEIEEVASFIKVLYGGKFGFYYDNQSKSRGSGSYPGLFSLIQLSPHP